MIAITTSSSMSVKPVCRGGRDEGLDMLRPPELKGERPTDMKGSRVEPDSKALDRTSWQL
jgi:hypothetical protein